VLFLCVSIQKVINKVPKLNQMKRIHIISGCSGAGKTEIIKDLKRRNYLCFDEVARVVIKSSLENNSGALPWSNRVKFDKLVLKKMVEDYDSADDNLFFTDRGIPEMIAFNLAKGFPIAEEIKKAAQECKYAKEVFLTPPWKEIFVNDNERRENFIEAEKVYNLIKKVYLDLGYEIIEIPKVDVKKRSDFILERLNLKNVRIL
jgi:predicted ATPase